MLEQKKVSFLKLSHTFVYQELTSDLPELCVSSPIFLSSSGIFCFSNLSGFLSNFVGLAVQLLQKLSITAVGGREKLLRVVKNPIEKYHLPVNSRKIG